MQSTGFKNLPETINGRAAMLGEFNASFTTHNAAGQHLTIQQGMLHTVPGTNCPAAHTLVNHI